MERLEICDKDDMKNPKIITLENCVKITHEPPPINLIHIVTKTDTLTLNPINEQDLIKWLAALQTVAFRDKSTTPPGSRNSAIEEDNDLYCTSYSDGMFTIRLVSSDISVKCHLESRTYVLHLTATDLQLKNADDNATMVAKWPYRYIRKYGYRDGKFTFEAGRKCDTGEGVFSLEHPNPQEVFRCMAGKMKTMKKLISGDSMASLDCGEHQFNAALSMEAGSRSPLPPSPNHHSHSESDLNQSGHLLRGFLSSNDSLNNVSMTSSTATPTSNKHIPNKPPRKSLGCILDTVGLHEKTQRLCPPKQLKYNKFQNYEPVTPTDASPSSHKSSGIIVLKTPPAGDSNKTILTLVNIDEPIVTEERPPELPVRNESKNCEERDYECIETITNAWRTRGIDEVKHTEHFSNTSPPDEILNDFVWQRSQSQKDFSSSVDRKLLSPMVSITATPPDPDSNENYDRLEFFAPKSSQKGGDYKTIVTVTSPGYKKQISQPVSSNDYEIIGGVVPDTQASRLADDSYLGYGVLRKTNVSPLPPQSTSPTTPTGHQLASTLNQTIKTTLLMDNDELLDHRKYNGLDYAIVSKPKRV